MPHRQMRKADGNESATDAADTASTRKCTRSQMTPMSVEIKRDRSGRDNYSVISC